MQSSWYNCKLKLSQRAWSYKSSEASQFSKGFGGVTSKKLTPEQSVANYLTQSIVSIRNRPLREKFNFYFQEFFPSPDKIFISGGGLSTRQ